MANTDYAKSVPFDVVEVALCLLWTCTLAKGKAANIYSGEWIWFWSSHDCRMLLLAAIKFEMASIPGRSGRYTFTCCFSYKIPGNLNLALQKVRKIPLLTLA